MVDFDEYVPSRRARLEIVEARSDYLPAIRRHLERLALEAPRFDLCLYNAGMDPHQDCALGGLAGIDLEIMRERERTVFGWCAEQRVPVAFVLAGGYVGGELDRARLVALHRLTLESAAAIARAS